MHRYTGVQGYRYTSIQNKYKTRSTIDSRECKYNLLIGEQLAKAVVEPIDGQHPAPCSTRKWDVRER